MGARPAVHASPPLPCRPAVVLCTPPKRSADGVRMSLSTPWHARSAQHDAQCHAEQHALLQAQRQSQLRAVRSAQHDAQCDAKQHALLQAQRQSQLRAVRSAQHDAQCDAGGSSVNALGERWKAVCRKVELQPRKKSELEMQNWLKEKLGEEVRSTQTTLSSFERKLPRGPPCLR